MQGELAFAFAAQDQARERGSLEELEALGVVVTIMIEVGMLTPPVGMNLFVLVGITKGEVPLGEAARASTPFWIAMIVGVAILTVFPGIATWLPQFIK
mgnify:CR=1 FL=1